MLAEALPQRFSHDLYDGYQQEVHHVQASKLVEAMEGAQASRQGMAGVVGAMAEVAIQEATQASAAIINLMAATILQHMAMEVGMVEAALALADFERFESGLAGWCKLHAISFPRPYC